MPLKHLLYENKKKLILLSVILISIGVLVGYMYYGTEPWETVGGFICGAGIAMTLIFMSLKQPK